LHVAAFQDSSVALCRQLALHCQLSFFSIVNHLALFKVGLDVARASTPTLKTAGYAGYLDV
jgi:hypothetical protein